MPCYLIKILSSMLKQEYLGLIQKLSPKKTEAMKLDSYIKSKKRERNNSTSLLSKSKIAGDKFFLKVIKPFISNMTRSSNIKILVKNDDLPIVHLKNRK